MRNLKVIISYDGTAYHGFQSQDNAITVQDVIEATIFKVTGIPSKIYGCSRTDTGVHAKVFVFHFHTTSPIPCSGFIKAMNNLLPRDIAVLSCEEVDESFTLDLMQSARSISISSILPYQKCLYKTSCITLSVSD